MLCAICLEAIDSTSATMVTSTPCAHTFHTSCLHAWYAVDLRWRCPTCRRSCGETADKTSGALAENRRRDELLFLTAARQASEERATRGAPLRMRPIAVQPTALHHNGIYGEATPTDTHTTNRQRDGRFAPRRETHRVAATTLPVHQRRRHTSLASQIVEMRNLSNSMGGTLPNIFHTNTAYRYMYLIRR